VKRRPAFFLCCTIVAVFQLQSAAAATVFEDVPLPGGTAALAQTLGIDPVPDRARFVSEIVRLLYNTPEGRKPPADAFLLAARQRAARDQRMPADTRAPELVPVPLTVDLWNSAIFRRNIAPRELVTAIVTDRAAALLCLGLSALDDRTLAYFADHPALLERIYERSAPAFGAFSSSLRVDNNRLVVPGAPRTAGEHDEVTPLWEALIPEKVTRPDRFITQLLELNEGKAAYVYDTIGQLDPARRAFALGLWITSAAARADRFKALVTGIVVFREAQLRTLPIGRAPYDATMTLARLEVGADGHARPPAARGFWSRLFAGTDLPDDVPRALRGLEEDPIDAAWLLETIGVADLRLRGERLDQIAFAQRVFAAAAPADRADVFVAVRALSRHRMLMWTLDRIGVRAPGVYAAAARQAARLGALEGRRGFDAQAQFQGGIALVARMVQVRTLDTARAETLIEQLVAVPLAAGEYRGGVAQWFRTKLLPVIPRATTIERAVLAAMSGAASGDGPVARSIAWEGEVYLLDLGAAERRRLQQVREKQEGAPLDAAIDLADAARALAVEKLTLGDAELVAERLAALLPDIPRRVGHVGDQTGPPGVGAAPNPSEALKKSLDELTKQIAGKDLKRAAHLAEPLGQQADTLLAQALLSIAYAAVVGDPDGAVMLADDVSRRHDFGLGAKDADQRVRFAWALPRSEVTPGVPWHVTGSLLGLDIGLAQLALRRLNFERVLEAPRLTSNERDSFALSVSLLNPFDLRDADRDAIADAIARGRQRVAAMVSASRAAGDSTADRLADELSLENVRRRAIKWMLAHGSRDVASMFSATELLALGGGRLADLHAWGMSMLTWKGCVCSSLTPPGTWPTLLGRPPLGLTAAGIADLNLHVAMMLKTLRLPAALAKVVLAGAMQDFIDEAKPTDDADWLTLARAAGSVSRERIEDYVGAATATGPLMPASGRSGWWDK
jgi:hypothetical protein